MRRFSLLIVLFTTACVGSYPVRIRPGSNMALPREGSWVGDVVNSYLCDKERNRVDRSSGVAQCAMRLDTLGPTVTVPQVPPPAKIP